MRSFLGAVRDLLTKQDEYKKIWGGPFNGQEKRRAIFKSIIERCNIESIVETGTYKGNTTTYMFETSKLPVYTVEKDSRSFYYSNMLFFVNPKVKVFLDDSRSFLTLLPKNVSQEKAVFFYLDAHWNADLPLQEEVKLILSQYEQAIIMIDDFKVPDDDGYAFDQYGIVELSIQYLNGSNNFLKNSHIFFPTTSMEETGAKRGCCLITNDENMYKLMSGIDLIKEHNNEEI